jgi:cyanophycin synthetase
LSALLRQGLAKGRRIAEISTAATELLAIAQTVQALQPGDLLVLGIESIEEALAFTQEQMATGETPALGSAGRR